MPILNDIIDWVVDKPVFWQVAIEKLICNGTLSINDILVLKEILKVEYGLSNFKFTPVDYGSLNSFVTSSNSGRNVVLSKIYNVQNINALAGSETLEFAPTGLTVVYGDNGSGKSSYVSILKHVCNTRGQKPTINDNFLDATYAGKDKIADVEYTLDGITFNSVNLKNGVISDLILKNVDVFDTKSANHYIEGEDEIAFIPIGLTILDKLAAALNLVERELNEEIQNLASRRFDPSIIPAMEGTSAKHFLVSINKNTSLDDLRKAADWKPHYDDRIIELEAQILSLKALDPTKERKSKEDQIRRFRVLYNRFKSFEDNLFVETEKFKTVLNDYINSKNTLEVTSTDTFFDLPINGIGNPSWKMLWESARSFYDESQGKEIFPQIGEGGKCPLCLQSLNSEAQLRFSKFEAFVKNDIQKRFNHALEKYNSLHEQLSSLNFDIKDLEPTVDELNENYPTYKEDQNKYVSNLISQREKLIQLLDAKKIIEFLDYNKLEFNSKEFINEIIQHLLNDVEVLSNRSIESELLPLQLELNQLKSLKNIFSYKPQLAKEICRQKREWKLTQCVRDCNTRSVTIFSNALTATYVTLSLKQNFQEELKKLGFKNIRVDSETKGIKGKQFHFLKLDEPHAKNISLKEVLSEGEHRCISLATFLAELSICDHQSAVIFDDPVSSLDHKWRNKIAGRIVEEAKLRQVIVFTHDITFLLMLQEHSAKLSSSIEIKNLTRKRSATGIIGTNPPWDALSVAKRTGVLKSMLQVLVKIEKTGTEDEYREKAKQFYGLLRETWERFVEEILLNKVVQRFGREIQTMRLKVITDITDADVNAIFDNMKKCSTYFTGHDSSGALIEGMPDTDEIASDLNVLENYCADMRKRKRN